MHVEPNCSLETTNWRIHGVQTASKSINLRFRPYLTLPPLNISWPLTPPVSLLQTLNITDRATFPWNDIPTLIAPTFTDFDTTLWEQYQPYFIAAIAVALTCCVAVLIFYYCRIGGFTHCRRPRSKSQTVVTARPDASTMATPTKAAVSYQPPFSHKAGTTLRMDAIAMHPASPYEQARALLDHALKNWSDVTSFFKEEWGVCKGKIAWRPIVYRLLGVSYILICTFIMCITLTINIWIIAVVIEHDELIWLDDACLGPMYETVWMFVLLSLLN